MSHGEVGSGYKQEIYSSPIRLLLKIYTNVLYYFIILCLKGFILTAEIGYELT